MRAVHLHSFPRFTRGGVTAEPRRPELPLLPLLHEAYVVRHAAFGNRVQVHVLNNARNARCPEDCGYCSQSAISEAPLAPYEWKDEEQLLDEARRDLVDPRRYSTEDVPVLIGTLGKAFGTSGAFVAGEQALIETLIQRSRNYIYTTAMPAALAAATLESLRIARCEEWRRERLEQLIQRFRSGAAEIGFELMNSQTPIQPLVIGDPARALAMSRALEGEGCLCTAIRPPTVPEGTSRLRITLTAAHRDEDVDRLLDALQKAPKCGDPFR